MKPEGAITGSIPADLSFCSLSDAMSALSRCHTGLSRWIIRVASQSFSQALMLAEVSNCEVELSLDYDPDEWSLTLWRVVDGKVNETHYWSPGA